MDNSIFTGGPPYGSQKPPEDWWEIVQALLQNQRDILFLLRSFHVAAQNKRIAISPETKRIHRQVIRLQPYNGHCPCCLETKVVTGKGTMIPPAQFDHFWGAPYSAPIHTWLICTKCHLALSNDIHLTWYRQLTTRFRAYQAAVEAYTQAFGKRTPARLCFPPRKIIP